MSPKSQANVVIQALLARGYCEGQVRNHWADPGTLFSNVRVWCISPTHKNVLTHRLKRRYRGQKCDLVASVVWLNIDSGRWRLGPTYGLAEPMPQAMRQALAAEGAEAILAAVARHIVSLKTDMTLEELGL